MLQINISNHLSDDDILEECECDFQYQYVLHTFGFENQPISDRTFSRFRVRVAAYELATGEDFIHTCITKLANNIAKFMEIEPDIKRMDSMMMEFNIKTMSRLDLLYTCLSNLVKTIDHDGNTDIIKGLENYYEPNNWNKVVYYERQTPQSEPIQKVKNDATKLLPKCKELNEENQ